MSLAVIHDNHLCANCGIRYGAHSGPHNPLAPSGGCPASEIFPKWPKIRDEKRAGELFDRRLAKFWQARKTTFNPKR